MTTKRPMGTIVGKLVATSDEVEMLALMLREVRHVMRTGQQLSISVDPFVAGDGLHLGFHYNGDGWTRPLEGKFNRARKRARRA